ncbi:RidA family protein [Falsigemmobacter intermedius]|uniref:RidA family protein n=1 Tax=Falsigemmobacter intermedius TaxID=1553448 RepID=A0A444M8Y8_9RHOB|nr:RidA family protein [Falsigemmobacter intermedius]RWY39143.1 RidA family protein [Falsigemmobacter intermedius]
MSELSPHEFLHPSGWKAAAGYANGVAARGKMVFLGGHIGWNGQQEFETDDLAGQVRQTLQNILDVLACAGGRAEHIVRLTWYVTDKKEYLSSLREIGSAYRDTLGKHFPAMALVQVVALVEDRAKVEIEATAVIPDEA